MVDQWPVWGGGGVSDSRCGTFAALDGAVMKLRKIKEQ